MYVCYAWVDITRLGLQQAEGARLGSGSIFNQRDVKLLGDLWRQVAGKVELIENACLILSDCH